MNVYGYYIYTMLKIRSQKHTEREMKTNPP